MFEYELSVLCSIGIAMIYALGQNIMMGYAGQPMMGVIALVAVGAYTSASLTAYFQLPFLIAFPMGCLMGAVLGLLFGWLTIRIREDYLAVASIGLIFIMNAVFIHTPWFGRMYGILDIARPNIFGLPFQDIGSFTVLTFIIVAIFIFLDIRLSRSKLGLALRAIRDEEHAAESLGINTVRTKALCFVIGAAYAGAGGSMLSFFLQTAHPNYFHAHFSYTIFLMPILGGAGSTVGSIIGATIITLLPEVLRFLAVYRTLIFAILLIIMPLVQPMGLLGRGSFLRRKIVSLYERLRGRKSA